MFIDIKLIVGLGNPGNLYDHTRHNIGFRVLDLLANELKSEFEFNKKFNGFLIKINRKKTCFYLLKPNTYMNKSGYSVSKILSFYKFKPEQILIVHDDIDLKPGIIKTKIGGSNAGHNGLKDIQLRIGSSNFWRIRIGVGHPKLLDDNLSVADYVLTSPPNKENFVLYESEKLCASKILDMLDNDVISPKI